MLQTILDRVPNFIVVFLVLLPNLFMLGLDHRNIQKGAGLGLAIIENIGRMGVFIIPFFYNVEINPISFTDRISLGGMFLTLALYYLGWAKLYMNRLDFSLLHSPIFFFQMVLSPIIYFAFLGLLLRSFPMLIAAIAFASGHIPISYFDFFKNKGDKDEKSS